MMRLQDRNRAPIRAAAPVLVDVDCGAQGTGQRFSSPQMKQGESDHHTRDGFSSDSTEFSVYDNIGNEDDEADGTRTCTMGL